MCLFMWGGGGGGAGNSHAFLCFEFLNKVFLKTYLKVNHANKFSKQSYQSNYFGIVFSDKFSENKVSSITDSEETTVVMKMFFFLRF